MSLDCVNRNGLSYCIPYFMAFIVFDSTHKHGDIRATEQLNAIASRIIGS